MSCMGKDTVKEANYPPQLLRFVNLRFFNYIEHFLINFVNKTYIQCYAEQTFYDSFHACRSFTLCMRIS